jgi:hypothetical protein
MVGTTAHTAPPQRITTAGSHDAPWYAASLALAEALRDQVGECRNSCNRITNGSNMHIREPMAAGVGGGLGALVITLVGPDLVK